MDIQVVIVAVFGLFTTTVSAFAGPYILDRIRRRLASQLRIQAARERPYIDFATALERTLLDLDMMARSDDFDFDEYRRHFREMEELRSALDLVGTQSVRVWAFRCRIAITSMSRNFHDPDKQSHYRTKLHIAKSEYVRHARAELGLASDSGPAPVSTREDSTAAHEKWLGDEVGVSAHVKFSSAEFGEWTLARKRELSDNDRPESRR